LEKKGYFNVENLRDIFLKYEIHFTPKELSYLFCKFDKEKKGEVYYGEFFKELTPKLYYNL
jgi:Ca2+-binding EF-hand superfamily protein